MRRKAWLPAAAALLVFGSGGVFAISTRDHANATTVAPAPQTATIQRSRLSDLVSGAGTLTYRANSDGSPYAVFNQTSGTYTSLPTSGEDVGCGSVLYRVDDRPVLLLCGPNPLYRSLSEGDRGGDVAELNAALVRLADATRAQLDPTSRMFSLATATAVRKLQTAKGLTATGTLTLGQAVVLPAALRVATVTAQLGGPAAAGPVLTATSQIPQVQVPLDPSQQNAVKVGNRVQITLPGNRVVDGRVERLGPVTPASGNSNGQSGASGGSGAEATVPAYISLVHPEQAHRYAEVSVQVQIATTAVANALNVPVTAIVATAGGGFAVEIAGAYGRRDLVPVTLGLFDDAAGRVQITGAVHAGEQVVVASS